MPWWDGCNAVHCGFWVNWSGGSAGGSTLTLPTQWGLVLTAFIALFIKVVGTYLWGIICFALHQSTASSEPEDDTFHQFQVTFRNTESETSFIWNLHKIAVAHKGTRFQTYKRSAWLILLAVLHGLGFAIAGGLSSQFLVASDQIQALPRKCGWMVDVPFGNKTNNMGNIANDTVFEQANALIVTARNMFQSSSIYSRICYARGEGRDTDCGLYFLDTLPYEAKLDAPCPFDQRICNSSAVLINSGPFRTDEHFGINTLAKDAMSLRKELTCAPINAENYSDGWFTTNTSVIYDVGTRVKGYKLGKKVLEDDDDVAFEEYTAMVAENEIKWGDAYYNLASLSHFQNYTGDKADLFTPIPELQTEDADLSLIYLRNRVSFRNPITDPFLNAQNCSTDKTKGHLCTSTNTLSFMGCNERYQFCTSDNKVCTPLTGLYALQVEPEGLNPTQKALYKILWKMIWSSQLNFQVGLIGSDNLVANRYLWDKGFFLGLSSKVPDNHWQQEVLNWMNTSLAVMQRSPASFARPGESDASSGISSLEYIVEPTDENYQLLCHKVKIRSAKFTSFSALRLFLILGFGILIIAANGFIPVLTAAWQLHYKRGVYKRTAWIESNTYQLLRLAAEGRSISPWEGKDEDVPVLKKRGCKFNLRDQSSREDDSADKGPKYQRLAEEESSP